MIEAYLNAAINQTRERAKVLKGKIPNPIPTPEFGSLQKACEERLDNAIGLLDYLANDPVINKKEAAKEKIRLFRRALNDLAQLEATGIAALNRVHRDDVFLNKLVFQIHTELKYPLLPPTVSCLSRDYFTIYPALGLLAVPLAESEFLLHLPDLYHEIAHPLISTTDNPKVEGFQQEFGKFLDIIIKHFKEEHAANIRSTGPKEYFAFVLDILERSWIKFWAAELFCDLFAVYTLGPAYAWAHFHLAATRDADPFEVKVDRIMSHPPDEARMEVILFGLALLDHQLEAAPIRDRWKELIQMTGGKANPLYRKACPKKLLEQAAVHAFEGTKKIGCRIAETAVSGKVHDLLNEAWKVFWKSPVNYHAWEKQQMRQLRQEY